MLNITIEDLNDPEWQFDVNEIRELLGHNNVNVRATIENMKQIYAIYCTIELLNPPDWLHDFRAKYDEPYDFHITLKQMSYIDRSVLPTVRKKLEEALETPKLPKQIEISFDHLQSEKYDPDSGTGFIYIFASQRNTQLDDLQKRIREELTGYSDYYFKNSPTYELNFNPHITIGRNIDSKTFDDALKDLPSQVKCVGRVTNIVLSCVPKLSPEEAKKSENLTIYSL